MATHYYYTSNNDDNNNNSRFDRFFVLKIITLITTLFGLLCLGESNSFSGRFVFGDGFLDAGNNNFISTLCKSNFYPNGIDFGEPTGRFTNGKTLVDILGQELGYKYFTLPYLSPFTIGPRVLEGVNYASGGAGILNQTGKIFVGRINMDTQINNFEATRQNITSIIGLTATMQLLKNALLFISIGSNDLLHNYLIPQSLSTANNNLVPPQNFVENLMSQFSLQLTRLYNLGARKIVVLNVGPIGCTPNQREANLNKLLDTCVVFPNWLAQLFNTQLKGLITQLSSTLEGSKFVYADLYSVMDDIIHNYSKYGFENSDSSCCYVFGRFGGLIPCGVDSKLCLERSKYVFWDPFNPSQAANEIIAKSLLDGDKNIISPINVRQLFQS